MPPSPNAALRRADRRAATERRPATSDGGGAGLGPGAPSGLGR